MSRTRLLLLAFGLFTICLMGNMGRSIKRLDQTVSNVNMQVSARSIDSYMQSPSEGDINITGHETLTMQDHEYNLTVRISARDHAIIAVKNAKLTLSPADSDGVSIVLKGRSRLLVTNSTIDFSRSAFGDCQIILQDEAQANLTETTLTGWCYIIGHDVSTVYVEKSNISNGVPSLHAPGIAIYDSSIVRVEDSIVDGVYVWENSTSSINRSDVGVVRTSWAESGKTTINITDSRLGTIVTSVGSEPIAGTAAIRIINSTVEYGAYVHHNSTAWIEKSSIATIKATSNATVWLVDSSVNEVSLEGEARVLLGWDLPLFGLVGVPYTWIPLVQGGSIVIIVVGLAVVSYAVYRRKRASEEHGNEVLQKV